MLHRSWTWGGVDGADGRVPRCANAVEPSSKRFGDGGRYRQLDVFDGRFANGA